MVIFENNDELSRQISIVKARLLFVDKIINIDSKNVSERLIKLKKEYIREYLSLLEFKRDYEEWLDKNNINSIVDMLDNIIL